MALAGSSDHLQHWEPGDAVFFEKVGHIDCKRNLGLMIMKRRALFQVKQKVVRDLVGSTKYLVVSGRHVR